MRTQTKQELFQNNPTPNKMDDIGEKAEILGLHVGNPNRFGILTRPDFAG